MWMEIKNAYGDGSLPSVSVAFLSMEERMEKEYLLFDLDGTLTDPKKASPNPCATP